MTHTYSLIAALHSSPSPTERTSSHPRKITDADCTNSYVLNSGVTEPNLTEVDQIWKKSTDPSSVHKELSYGEKIAKIGPVRPEIFDEIRRTT